jgi:aldo/keto reductase
MKKEIIFRNQVTVPVLGQGTWNMGENAFKKAEELKVLQKGIELGMTAIDTAEIYGEGRSEILVGEAIKGLREKVFLISKIAPSHASHRRTRIACENSLKRLKTDYLDLYLLHWKSRIPINETICALQELQKEGKIKQWGVSNMDTADMEEIYALPEGNNCGANEVLYNLTRRGIEYDLLPWCQKNHLPLIAYSPIEQGRLLNHSGLKAIADKHSATPSQIALAWICRHPDVLAIPQTSSLEHLEENFKSLSIRLTEEDLTELDRYFPAPTQKKRLEMI